MVVKVVIIGSGGRLGGAIARHFGSNHRVVAFDRKGLDLSRPEIIDDRLLPIEFDLLINTAAITGVDYCEHHQKEAYSVNAGGAGQMARICASKGARMVQVSTDYVYDGTEPGEKSETSPLNPLGVYAKSKLAGELAVQAEEPTALILRTAWIFGPDRPSFIDLILDRAVEEERVDAIADKYASPTFSTDFAGWLEPLVSACPSGGVFNCANSGGCSWQQYAQEALRLGEELGLELNAKRVMPLLISEMEAFIAERPTYTILSTMKLSGVIQDGVRSWQAAVGDYLATFYAKS